MSREELSAITRQLSARDRVLSHILAGTGYRLDDVMHTRVWQWLRPEIELRERKTGKLRRVQIPAQLQRELHKHFRKRNSLRFAFPALRTGGRKKMHRTTYWRHFVAAAKAAGLKGRTPHGLRKLYAVELYRRCGELSAVQADLNHSRPEVTLIYALADRY